MKTWVVALLMFGSLVVSSAARADAVSCQSAYPVSCPFNYASTGRPVVIELKDFNCASDPIAASPVSDRVCWQQALSCARDAGDYGFGVVRATEGVVYEIDDTLCVVGALHGVIDGNGSRLDWTGDDDELSPMFYFANVEMMKIDNLNINSAPWSPMHTGIVFGSKVVTSGPPVSHKNLLQHIVINGTDTGGLQYGIRFAGPSSFASNPLGLWDANNDLFTITDSNIGNVDQAGISLEHSQSFSHHIRNVEITAAADNDEVVSDDCPYLDSANGYNRDENGGCAPATSEYYTGGSGIRLLGGSYNAYGGFIGGFANAAYFGVGTAPITIVDHHSEGCGHLFRTYDGAVGFASPVSILGGRYSADHIDADLRIIDWHRFGPLKIDGLQVDGYSGGTPIRFHIDAQPIGGNPDLMSEVDISHLYFVTAGSASYSDIFNVTNPSRTHLVSVGNQCSGANGAEPCPGLGGGTDQAVASVKNKDFSDASNVFPTTLLTTTGSQTVTNKDLTSGTNSFPSTLLTTTGTQTVTNKDLTSGTNSFPSTLLTTTGTQTVTNKDLTSTTNTHAVQGLLAFTNAVSKSSTQVRYCGPGTATADATESNVSVPSPGFAVNRMDCKASAAPGSGKSVTMTLRAAGSDTAATCAISTTTSCSYTSSSTSLVVTDGQDVSLKVTPAGNPGTPTVQCIVRAGR